MSFLRRLAIVCLSVIALLHSSHPGLVQAQTRPVNVTGRFTTQQFGGENCPSPVGICSAGTVTGTLNGTVSVVILTAGNALDAQGNPLFTYTATITMATDKGNLSGVVAGQVSTGTGRLISAIRINSGTGDYAGRTGTLIVFGNFNFATGAESDFYTGFLR